MTKRRPLSCVHTKLSHLDECNSGCFLEVLMEDFSIFGDTFKNCVKNLELVLCQCEEINLVFNWENVTSWFLKLSPPTTVKGIRSFLCHVGFYRRFIKDSLKIPPLAFNFDEPCLKAFEELKKQLVTAPIFIAPDSTLCFELMCDANDFTVRVILGQKKGEYIPCDILCEQDPDGCTS
ncbi:DNA/RNA polymerases superfamily protein [Gossypium australe]|uniref:DNA/RNA polymerases superfamily protein n=1 Tax=Gossypium australe TaxID=47621 RepID=A0A5B6UUQ2_9ROSI|nr:DNA/RNA polymerases superfamily protein [Gossypium australe]